MKCLRSVFLQRALNETLKPIVNPELCTLLSHVLNAGALSSQSYEFLTPKTMLGADLKELQTYFFCVNKLQKIHSVIQSDMTASIQRQDLACQNRIFSKN